MDAYSNMPRNPYGFLGCRPATNPVINSNGRTGTRVPPSGIPAGSYEVACDRPQIVDEFLKKIQTEVSQPAWPPAMYQSPYEFPRAAPMVQFGMPRSETESGFVVQSHEIPPTIRTTPAPPRVNAKISRAMNDIAEATEHLKELARPSIPNNDTITVPQNMVLSPDAVSKGSVPVTIDSREAARRYKNVIVSMEPYGKEISTPILDSKTAKDKYRGVFV